MEQSLWMQHIKYVCQRFCLFSFLFLLVCDDWHNDDPIAGDITSPQQEENLIDWTLQIEEMPIGSLHISICDDYCITSKCGLIVFQLKHLEKNITTYQTNL